MQDEEDHQDADIATAHAGTGMTKRDSELAPDDPRRIVKAWVGEAWRHSKLKRFDFSCDVDRSETWLSKVLSTSDRLVPSAQMLKVIEQVSGLRAPDAVWTALQGVVDRRGSRRRGTVVFDAAGLHTAEDVIAKLIDATVLRKIPNGPVQAEYVRRRFGIGGRPPQTLEQIGSSAGVTRERIRQIEARMFEAVGALKRKQFPIAPLDAIVDRVMASDGMPWEVVETELKPLLGGVTLREAFRFAQALRGERKRLAYDDAVIYAHDSVRVVATTPAHARFLTAVSHAARKFHSYAGATTIHDVRAYLEHHGKSTLELAEVRTALNALPGLVWLGRGDRWFTFLEGDALSPLLQRAAAIITLARTPVEMDTIYAGLVRETKRQKASEAERFIDPIPPCSIVQEILDKHPVFVRSAASSFGLRGSVDIDGIEGDFNRAIIERMEQLGGVATLPDLEDITLQDGRKITKYYLGVVLYLAFFIERIGTGIYALRGRAVSDEAIAAAKARGRVPERIRTPAGGQWTATVYVTPAMRKYSNIAFTQREIPESAGGSYTLPDGHVARLIDDRHGIRLVHLGPVLKHALGTCQHTLTFHFDKTAGTVTLEADVDTQPTATMPTVEIG